MCPNIYIDCKNKTIKAFIYITTIITIIVFVMFGQVNCANPNPPGGGPKDSIPPMLMGVSLPNKSVNFNKKELIFFFNENIQLKDIKQITINPVDRKNRPDIYTSQNRLNFVWSKGLRPNTTYSISLRRAISDLNENNFFDQKLYYTFSTGNTLDANTVYGRVLQAENGKVDSTMMVTLYDKLEDSAVVNEYPKYTSFLDTLGNYVFWNVQDGQYKLYAVKDASNTGRYISKSQLFAFEPEIIEIIGGEAYNMSTMYAFTEKEKTKKIKGKEDDENNDTLIFKSLIPPKVTVYDSLVVSITPIPTFVDTTKITLLKQDSIIVDSLSISGMILEDSSAYHLIINYPIPDSAVNFRLAIDSTIAYTEDSIPMSFIDTLKFTSTATEEYGSMVINHNLQNTKRDNYILNIRKGDKIIMAVPLTQPIITVPYLLNGEYSTDILNDKNNNGRWDFGSFFEKQQPEISIALKNPIIIVKEEETTYIIDLDTNN